MDCLQCGGAYTERSGTYSLPDRYVGEVLLQGVSYYQCDSCGAVLYSPQMARQIEAERSRMIQEILTRFPIRDFATAAETASILGISRQALHKNRRIRHGFIYQTTLGPSTFYLRRSIDHYRRFGDGRFCLRPRTPRSCTQYREHLDAMRFFTTAVGYNMPTIQHAHLRDFLAQPHFRSKEYSHGT
jgi:hypothetical protein